MASSQTSARSGHGRRGRPRKKRFSPVELARIKKEVEECYGGLPSFYKDAFDEAIKPKYKDFKQPCDSDTVKDAFAHFFSGSRSLPKIYRLVLVELTRISIADPDDLAIPENKEIRLENPTHFILATKNTMPQWADSRELDLGGGQLKSLTCKIETESPYFRFGFKLLENKKRLFGDGSIKSQDANLVAHIGRNNWSRSKPGISARDIFFTWYLNGVSLQPDKKLFSANRNFSATIELAIDSSFNAIFSVNGICCLKQIIPPGISRRVAVLAWGDREEYAVEVKELAVKVE